MSIFAVLSSPPEEPEYIGQDNGIALSSDSEDDDDDFDIEATGPSDQKGKTKAIAKFSSDDEYDSHFSETEPLSRGREL